MLLQVLYFTYFCITPNLEKREEKTKLSLTWSAVAWAIKSRNDVICDQEDAKC